MRVAIVRRQRNVSFSMDVYADGLVRGLRAVRPDWDILELQPEKLNAAGKSVGNGLQKYYTRYWHYPRAVRANPAEIFHVIDHSDGHVVNALSRTGRPAVVTCHDLINYRQPENISNQARLPFISQTIWKYAVRGICQASHVITVSSYTAQDAQQLMDIPPQQLTVVPNAVDGKFRPLSADIIETMRQRYNLPADAFCLLNVGSNHPRKNITAVVKALSRLHQQGIQAYFLKAGANLTEAQNTYVDEQGLRPWIRYVGKPDESELIELYNTADVLVSPSLYEGFGMTILEAMACGTPVVTSNTSSLPEVAGNAALLVDPKDEDAIATAISSLRTDQKLRETLISRGLERTQSYTWENTAEQVACVYESVLQEKS